MRMLRIIRKTLIALLIAGALVMPATMKALVLPTGGMSDASASVNTELKRIVDENASFELADYDDFDVYFPPLAVDSLSSTEEEEILNFAGESGADFVFISTVERKADEYFINVSMYFVKKKTIFRHAYAYSRSMDELSAALEDAVQILRGKASQEDVAKRRRAPIEEAAGSLTTEEGETPFEGKETDPSNDSNANEEKEEKLYEYSEWEEEPNFEFETYMPGEFTPVSLEREAEISTPKPTGAKLIASGAAAEGELLYFDKFVSAAKISEYEKDINRRRKIYLAFRNTGFTALAAAAMFNVVAVKEAHKAKRYYDYEYMTSKDSPAEISEQFDKYYDWSERSKKALVLSISMYSASAALLTVSRAVYLKKREKERGLEKELEKQKAEQEKLHGINFNGGIDADGNMSVGLTKTF